MKEEEYLEKLDETAKDEYEEGVRLLEARKFIEAEKIFLKLNESRPDFVPLYNKWSIIYIYQKDYDKAVDILMTALQLDNKYAPAITNLGNIMREKGNLRKAEEYYLKAIEVDEEYGPAYNNLGVIYREKGNYSKSVKYLKKANKYHSYHVDLDVDKPFYKEPGCLLIIIMIIIVLLFTYYIFS